MNNGEDDGFLWVPQVKSMQLFEFSLYLWIFQNRVLFRFSRDMKDGSAHLRRLLQVTVEFSWLWLVWIAVLVKLDDKLVGM